MATPEICHPLTTSSCCFSSFVRLIKLSLQTCSGTTHPDVGLEIKSSGFKITCSWSITQNWTACNRQRKPLKMALLVLIVKRCFGFFPMISQKGGHCGRFECEKFHLQTSEAVYFNLTAEVTLHNMKEFQSVSDWPRSNTPDMWHMNVLHVKQ